VDFKQLIIITIIFIKSVVELLLTDNNFITIYEVCSQIVNIMIFCLQIYPDHRLFRRQNEQIHYISLFKRFKCYK